MNIAVTGGMGSGKSFVAKELARILGCEYVSADKICRNLLEPGNLGYVLVSRTFPDRFFMAGGEIDRTVLRQAIFSDSKLRLKLNDILHPLAREEMKRLCSSAEAGERNLVVEVPLLFETGWQDDFDCTLVVFADAGTCISRVVHRDLVPENDALKAYSSQMTLEEKCSLGDRIIDNSGTFEETRAAVRLFATEIQ